MSVSIRRSLRSVLARAYRMALGPANTSIADEIARHNLDRWTMFVRTADFVNFERVEGDVLEFGVFGGVSLALLACAHRCDPKGMTRRIVGYDSFRGLPDSAESHSRWKEGDCGRMHGWHPTLKLGDPVTAGVTLDLFRQCGLDAPELEVGLFQETIPTNVPAKYRAAAVVHIDCDVYESAKAVLDGIEPILQEGTVLLFDEWFSYKGNPHKGEARAFFEFLETHPEWGAQHYQTYGPYSDSYILYRK
ncbi:MAG: TylF/MycF/NovP-related O-methyltransferase [Vicinamibacteria bacterium]